MSNPEPPREKKLKKLGKKLANFGRRIVSAPTTSTLHTSSPGTPSINITSPPQPTQHLSPQQSAEEVTRPSDIDPLSSHESTTSTDPYGTARKSLSPCLDKKKGKGRSSPHPLDNLKYNHSTGNLGGRLKEASRSAANLFSPSTINLGQSSSTLTTPSRRSSCRPLTGDSFLPNIRGFTARTTTSSIEPTISTRPPSPEEDEFRPRRLLRVVPIERSQWEMVSTIAAANNDQAENLAATWEIEEEFGISAEMMMEALHPSLDLDQMMATAKPSRRTVQPILLVGAHPRTDSPVLSYRHLPPSVAAPSGEDEGAVANTEGSTSSSIAGPAQHPRTALAPAPSLNDGRDHRGRTATSGTITRQNYRDQLSAANPATPPGPPTSSPPIVVVPATPGGLGHPGLLPAAPTSPPAIGVIDQALDSFSRRLRNQDEDETPRQIYSPQLPSPLPAPPTPSAALSPEVIDWVPPDAWSRLDFGADSHSIPDYLRRAFAASLPLWFVGPDKSGKHPEGSLEASFFFIDKEDVDAQMKADEIDLSKVGYRPPSSDQAGSRLLPPRLRPSYSSPSVYQDGMSMRTMRAEQIRQGIQDNAFQPSGQRSFFHSNSTQVDLAVQNRRPENRDPKSDRYRPPRTTSPTPARSGVTLSRYTALPLRDPSFDPTPSEISIARLSESVSSTTSAASHRASTGDPLLSRAHQASLGDPLSAVAERFPLPPGGTSTEALSSSSGQAPFNGIDDLFREVDDMMAALSTNSGPRTTYGANFPPSLVALRPEDEEGVLDPEEHLELNESRFHHTMSGIEQEHGSDESSGGTVLSPSLRRVLMEMEDISDGAMLDTLEAPDTPFAQARSEDPLSPLDTTSIHRGNTGDTPRYNRLARGSQQHPPLNIIRSIPGGSGTHVSGPPPQRSLPPTPTTASRTLGRSPSVYRGGRI